MTVLSIEELAGITPDELEQAFELVRDPLDWRNRIDAVIESDEVERVCIAIRFYTATDPDVMVLGDGRVRVMALGYRLGPAGDR